MKKFKVGDLFKFVDSYDLHNIGHGSIGVILETRPTFIMGFVSGKRFRLPYHHIVEVKC